MDSHKKTYNRKREIFLRFMVDEKERDMIYARMKEAGIGSLRAFLLKMALNGRIIKIELDSVREMVRLLSNATSNINQIARRVNERGSIFAPEIDDLNKRYDELWTQIKEILRRLAAI
ncbi:MAG: MobC family plasmid mobilization relaxosome protein [Oscillospiraceae bacterium]|nr:MobC family plasmid mobilization relaxosome protein [Oscillospiraceae bacterium]